MTTPKPKLTFWQRVVAFFARDTKKTTAPPPPPKPREKPAVAATAAAPKEKISRKPELVEVTSPKLYVGNLSFDATESDLFNLFNGVGQVRNAEVVCHKYTQRSKGFAFVQMTTIEEARRAVKELHDKEFLGRKLVVSGAKTPDMERAACFLPPYKTVKPAFSGSESGFLFACGSSAIPDPRRANGLRQKRASRPDCRAVEY
ncbi:MAG TPA: RNA-binding protein [Chthoniobacterales bacterium]|nr:RNA-binding protein [Chthoniobacterales bacterium]